MSEPAEGSSQPDLLSRIITNGPVRPPLKPAVNQPSRKQAPAPQEKTERRVPRFAELDQKIAHEKRLAEERKESRAKASKKPGEFERREQKVWDAMDRAVGTPLSGLPESPERPYWDVRPDLDADLETLENGGSTEEAADLLGNTPAMIRKHYLKWTARRQDRISNLMRAILSGTPAAHVEKAAVVN